MRNMPELSTVVLLALLPGVGVAAGGLIAELAPSSKKWLNWSLHAADGIVIAIAAIEGLPEALDSVSHWTVSIAFAIALGRASVRERGCKDGRKQGEAAECKKKKECNIT